jgi:Uma2 family endonuclease
MGAIDYYTYSDYVHWEGKWELIYGSAYAMSPSPMINHQAIANMFAFEFTSSIKDCQRCLVLSEEDWRVDDATVLKPDVVLICDEPHDAYITKAPEIIVEVVSQRSSRRDEKFKFEIYEKEKVKYYILAYPDDLKAKIYRLVGDRYTKEGDFSKELYEFENTTCKVSANFENIFKKFRKK